MWGSNFSPKVYSTCIHAYDKWGIILTDHHYAVPKCLHLPTDSHQFHPYEPTSVKVFVKEMSTDRNTSWMAIYLRSCDSILVSYNDVLGRPMVSLWVSESKYYRGGGGGSKYYDSILTTRSKYYIVFWVKILYHTCDHTDAKNCGCMWLGHYSFWTCYHIACS